MQLKPDTETALDKWVRINTWHTPHHFDMERWYDFVNQYQMDHGFVIEESDLREVIVRKAECGDNEALCDIINRRISLAYDILDFLKHTRR